MTRSSATWLVLGSLLALATPGRAAQDPEDDAPRFFRVPLTRDARTFAESAEGFVREENWFEVVEELQMLLDEHGGDVLPESYGSGGVSQFAVYPGAATWAHRRLRELPNEVRERYRERYADMARIAFDDARGKGDRKALGEVARRWPLTDAGIEAWWALGDLELELGNVEAARACWERGREALELCGLMPSPGAATRIKLAAAIGDGTAEVAAIENADVDSREGFTLPSPGGGPGPIPMKSSDRWELTNLDLGPFAKSGRHEKYNLFPVLADDRVLVSTTLRLLCYDAFSSELLWKSDEPRGWSEKTDWLRRDLFEAIDYDLNLLAPAAGGGVCVAALQIPYASQEDHDYQGIEILTPIPERRLYAFDLETGRELWNHAPPENWDSESGPYQERMLVGAAPVVAGSRVIVPCYRMRGRIDFHVACYDLTTGARLWSTGLVSGQRELNMFGRQTEEYCGAPVAIEGDRVFVLSQLGTVAALDLFSGRILWESRYEQIPIPKNRGWSNNKRNVVWKNAPPVVADGVVVVTPLDSYSLLGLDAEHGTVLWSYDYDRLPAARASRDDDEPLYHVLIGADEDTVYLAGRTVSALQKPGGLHFKAVSRITRRHDAFQARWSIPLAGNFDRLPRPVLGADEILIPTYDERLVVDRRTGARIDRKTLAWGERERGNALVGKGVLFLLGNKRLSAFFDWDILLERAEADIAARPDDVEATTEYGALLLRRARALYLEGSPVAAMPLLAKAREVLEPHLLGPGGQRNPRVAENLHEVLRTEAETQKLQANSLGALAILVEALALAADPADVRDTLLEQEEILRDRDAERWRAALAQLEARCADLAMPPGKLATDVDWLTGESLLVLAPSDLEGAEVPVGLWVLFSRARAWAREGQVGRALEDLHQAIARYGERRLAFGLSVSDVARSRIDRRLEMDGRRGYAPFEERAGELFERAVAARDPHMLSEIARLYPHSKAAGRAEKVQLEWAFDSGDAALAAALAFRTLEHGPRATERDALTLLRVGAVLRARGNATFERELVGWLARDFGELRSNVPEHEGRTLSDLARQLATASTPAPRPVPSFDEGLRQAAVFRGRYELVGELPPPASAAEEAATATLVVRHKNRLSAFAADDPTRERWYHELEFPLFDERLVLLPDKVIAGGADRVIALRGADGDTAWEWRARNEEIKYVSATSGVVLVLTTSTDPTTGLAVERVRALDAHAGIELWDLPTGEHAGWIRPVCGEGVAVFLRPLWAAYSVALVVDVFRGRVVSEFDLRDAVLDTSWEAAWIEEGRVVVPFFSASKGGPSRVAAYDYERGGIAWTLTFEKGQELSNVVSSQGENYLIVLAVSSRTGGDAGSILRLESDGRERAVHSLKMNDDPIGLVKKGRTVLPEPVLFIHSRRGGARTTPIRMINLARLNETIWSYHLPVSREELYDVGLPRPAVSNDTVVIAYTTKNRSNLMRDKAYLEFVDKNGGFRRDSRVLGPEMCKSTLTLYGLGRALLVLGDGRHGGRDVSRMEIMETVR